MDGQPSSSIIEAPSGRPTSKLLAASPGPDGSPSSRAQTRGTGQGCCGADRGTGQGSYGRKPNPGAATLTVPNQRRSKWIGRGGATPRQIRPPDGRQTPDDIYACEQWKVKSGRGNKFISRLRRRAMPRKRHILVVMLIAIGTIGIGANSASAAAGHQVPFQASYSGTAAFTSVTTALFTGTGIASRLGRSTNENHITVTGPASCPGGIANINVETLTAANGDQLMLKGPHDVGCPSPTDPNVVHGTGAWTVAGGTGRFAGATGQGTFVGGANFTNHTFWFQLTGTISAPGGD